jgi:hypothetical protein
MTDDPHVEVIELPLVPTPREVPAGGGLRVRIRPEETAYPINVLEYDILLSGEEVPFEKDVAFTCVGAFVASAAAAIGIFCTAEISQFKGATRILFDGLILICLLNAIIGSLSWKRSKQPSRVSYFKNLKSRIDAVLKP